MIHYHGTPISPRTVLATLAGRNFCVSFASPQDLAVVHQIGQSVMLDNGAFTFWCRGQRATPAWWKGFCNWCEPWLERPTDWAVIPDSIGGTEEENDALIAAWPFGDRGAPVWHLHEPVDRLQRLADQWPRVCFGSSGDFAELGTPQWHRRMEQAFNALCGSGPPPIWLHMLRGMALSDGPYPFASVDSTDVARNHNRPQNTALKLATRWDAMQPAVRWQIRDQMAMEVA